MIADKFERYTISHVPEGLQISLWEALPNLGFGVIALVILAACFVTDPYQGHGKIWAGLGVVALALVALFGVRIENWIIADTAIRYQGTLWSNELLFERSPDTPLHVRVELIPADSEGTQPPFPHVVHLIGPGGIEVGDGFRFRKSSSLDLFLATIQSVSPINVDCFTSGMDYLDEGGKPLADMSSPSPD
jgi:hypothetical protein